MAMLSRDAIGKHVIVGSGSVILPVPLEDGVMVGALSLVNRHCEVFGIYAGNPARRVKCHKRDLLELERQLLASNGNTPHQTPMK